MTDIVERLRNNIGGQAYTWETISAAADEIKWLREVIELIAMHPVGETKEWERGAIDMLRLARNTAANWGWKDPIGEGK